MADARWSIDDDITKCLGVHCLSWITVGGTQGGELSPDELGFPLCCYPWCSSRVHWVCEDCTVRHYQHDIKHVCHNSFNVHIYVAFKRPNNTDRRDMTTRAFILPCLVTFLFACTDTALHLAHVLVLIRQPQITASMFSCNSPPYPPPPPAKPSSQHLSIVPVDPSSMISFLDAQLWGLVLSEQHFYVLPSHSGKKSGLRAFFVWVSCVAGSLPYKLKKHFESGHRWNRSNKTRSRLQLFRVRYKHKTRGGLSMQLDCRELYFKHSDRCFVPTSSSQNPSWTFLLLSAFSSPCMSLFLIVPPPVSFCASSASELSPPLSPSSCLVFSRVVLVLCCWWELCTTGHKGMKIFSQAAEFTRLKCTETPASKNCDTHNTNQRH